MKQEKEKDEKGFALITVLMLSAMVAVLLGAHFFLTRVELSTTKSSMDGTRGFFAAEAGLNLRAEEVRKKFLGYNRPTGTSPVPIPGNMPCDGGTPGTGDFACVSYDFTGREVRTFLHDDEGSDIPVPVVIPPGEEFQGLTALEYNFLVSSTSVNDQNRPEALLEMQFKSRLIPLFQFAAFYDKDLEILPGPNMTFEGPVHSNGNLFMDAGIYSTLTVDGQVTTAGQLFKGRKDNGTCSGGDLVVYNLSGPQATEACPGGTRYELLQDDVNGVNPPHLDWEGAILVGASNVDVPLPEELDPVPGSTYWDKADLRIMLDLPTSSIKVMNPDGSPSIINTTNLSTNCYTAVETTLEGDTPHMHSFREGSNLNVLDVNLGELMNCIESTVPGLMGGKTLDDTTEGGLVWYFGVSGPNQDVPNNYAVRVSNGYYLGPTSGPTDIEGLTIVTNQALYVQGDYNFDDGPDWRPAAFLADSLNVLSNNWDDNNSEAGLASRLASHTTIRAAFLAGTDSSGDNPSAVPPLDGEGTLSTGNYNGGLENYPRFHEDWYPGGVLQTLTYRGSFVSLNRPIRVDGLHTAQSYTPPMRDWGYDTHFNDADNLPPLTPQFVYLKHEMFAREYEY